MEPGPPDLTHPFVGQVQRMEVAGPRDALTAYWSENKAQAPKLWSLEHFG